MSERAVIILKPDCLARSLSTQVLEQVTAASLAVLHRQQIYFTTSDVRRLYAHHLQDDTFPLLLSFMQSGPCELVAVEGHNCVAKLRQLKGRTGSGVGIRGLWAEDFIRNVLHVPDTRLQAYREASWLLPSIAVSAAQAKPIFALAGPSESGKSTVGLYLEGRGLLRLKLFALLDQVRKARWPDASETGEWVRSLLFDQPLTLQLLVGDAVTDALEAGSAPACSIESLGDPQTVIHLRSRFGSEFKLLYIDAPASLRAKRQAAVLGLPTLAEGAARLAVRDAQKESLWHLSSLQGLADHHIRNDGSLATLFGELDRILLSHGIS